MNTKRLSPSRPWLPALLGVAGLSVPLQLLHAADLYESGHADIGVGYDAGALDPHWHAHGGTVVNGAPLPGDTEYAPDELVAFVPDPSINRPPGAQWDFLGTPAGSPLWFLPQGENPAKPFLGIASEELDPADWSSLTLSLAGFSGPAGGEFSLWQSDVFGTPVVGMATADGVDAGDRISMTVGGHDHFNYGFTQPGVYEITLQWDGVHQTDGPVTTSATYGFAVQAVPEPGTTTLLVLGAMGCLVARRRR